MNWVTRSGTGTVGKHPRLRMREYAALQTFPSTYRWPRHGAARAEADWERRAAARRPTAHGRRRPFAPLLPFAREAGAGARVERSRAPPESTVSARKRSHKQICTSARERSRALVSLTESCKRSRDKRHLAYTNTHSAPSDEHRFPERSWSLHYALAPDVRRPAQRPRTSSGWRRSPADLAPPVPTACARRSSRPATVLIPHPSRTAAADHHGPEHRAALAARAPRPPPRCATATLAYGAAHTGHRACRVVSSILARQASCTCRSVHLHADRRGAGALSVQMKHSGEVSSFITHGAGALMHASWHRAQSRGCATRVRW